MTEEGGGLWVNQVVRFLFAIIDTLCLSIPSLEHLVLSDGDRPWN